MTSKPEADLDVVRSVYQALAERDFDRLMALVDDAVVITQDPALPWGGRYEGHAGFGQFALTLTSAIESAVTAEALFTADGDVIQCGRTHGTVRATGTPFDVPEVHRWTIRDGRVVAAHFAIDTAAMLDALGATADLRDDHPASRLRRG
jgi:ketosteroid isomerase-like protein